MPRKAAIDLASRIAHLPAGDYADAIVTGLTARVRASGRRSFVLRYIDPAGRSVKFKLGDYPDLSVAQARKRARALRRGSASCAPGPARAPPPPRRGAHRRRID